MRFGCCVAWTAAALGATALWGGGEVIGRGDILKVEVLGEADLTGNFAVKEDGNVQINWVEPIPVAGLTVEEAQDAVRKALDEKYVILPKVSLSMAEYKSRMVSFMGEVAKPGNYALKKDSTLLSLLLAAGGPTDRAGDLLIILRPTGPSDYDSSDVSLRALLTRADPEQNKPLEPGDILYIGSSADLAGKGASDAVYVLGAVKSSGSFRHRKGYTLLDAVIDAGGVNKFASANGTKIYRGRGKERKTIDVRLGDILNKGDRNKNVELLPGDLIIVPQGIL